MIEKAFKCNIIESLCALPKVCLLLYFMIFVKLKCLSMKGVYRCVSLMSNICVTFKRY